MENIKIDAKGDIIFLTVGKYELFLSKGKVGMDAYLMYSHLMYTGRLQATNQVWATNSYIKNGLKWGEDKLRNAKNLLKELGLIEQIEQTPDKENKGKFNKPYIKIITNTPLSQSSTGTPKTRERSEPIPVNRKQMLKGEREMLKGETETTSKEVVSDSTESLNRVNKDSRKNYKKTPSEIKKERFIRYWNTKPNLTTHRENTKTYDETIRLFTLLNTTGFRHINDISPEYAKNNNIDDSYRDRKWMDSEIYEAIDRYNEMLGKDFGPVYKQKLTKSCNSFIFNPRTRSSLFLACAGQGREPVANKAIPLSSGVVEKYRTAFFKGKRMNGIEKNELIRAANFVFSRQEQYENEIGKYITNSRIKDSAFFEVHIKFIRDRYFDGGFFDISKVLNQNIWKKYVVWLSSEYKINLFPSKKDISNAKNLYEEECSENKKNMEIDEGRKKIEEERKEWSKNRKSNRFQVSHA